MGDSAKTLRQVLLSQVEGLVVSRASTEGSGFLELPAEVMRAAGFFPHEKVDVYDVTCGTRLALPVVFGADGSDEVVVSGAAAHLLHAGDVLTLAAYGWLREKAAARATPRRVTVDAENRLVAATPRPSVPLPPAKGDGGKKDREKEKKKSPRPGDADFVFRQAKKKAR